MFVQVPVVGLVVGCWKKELTESTTYVGKFNLKLQRLLKFLLSSGFVGAEENGDVYHVLVVGLHQLVGQAAVQVLAAQP